MEDGGGRMRGGPEEGRRGGECRAGVEKKGEFEIRRTNPNDLGMSKNFFLHSSPVCCPSGFRSEKNRN